MGERILLPGEDDGVVLSEAPREIRDTTLADSHADAATIRKQLEEGAEDWGDGFLVQEQPVLVQRGPDGSIVRTTPLNEIPGVEFNRGKLERVDDIKEVEEVPTPVPLPNADREKLVGILAHRLWNYYRERGPKDPRYNPFRDGIPDLPAGSPEHLQPLPGTPLYPATDAQIYEWVKRFVAERVTVINKNRFGGNTLQDLALHIE